MGSMHLALTSNPNTITAGGAVTLVVQLTPAAPNAAHLVIWSADAGAFVPLQNQLVTTSKLGAAANAVGQYPAGQPLSVGWDTTDVRQGSHTVAADGYQRRRDAQALVLLGSVNIPVDVTAIPEAAVAPGPGAGVTTVTMRRAESAPTTDQALWTVIRNTSNALSFNSYNQFMDVLMCGEQGHPWRNPGDPTRAMQINRRLKLPFPDTDAYRQLKVATEVFLMVNCGVYFDDPRRPNSEARLLALEQGTDAELRGRRDAEGRRYYRAVQPGDIETIWRQLLDENKLADHDTAGNRIRTLPYLAIVRKKLTDVPIVDPD